MTLGHRTVTVYLSLWSVSSVRAAARPASVFTGSPRPQHSARHVVELYSFLLVNEVMIKEYMSSSMSQSMNFQGREPWSLPGRPGGCEVWGWGKVHTGRPAFQPWFPVVPAEKAKSWEEALPGTQQERTKWHFYLDKNV